MQPEFWSVPIHVTEPCADLPACRMCSCCQAYARVLREAEEEAEESEGEGLLSGVGGESKRELDKARP